MRCLVRERARDQRTRSRRASVSSDGLAGARSGSARGGRRERAVARAADRVGRVGARSRHLHPGGDGQSVGVDPTPRERRCGPSSSRPERHGTRITKIRDVRRSPRNRRIRVPRARSRRRWPTPFSPRTHSGWRAGVRHQSVRHGPGPRDPVGVEHDGVTTVELCGLLPQAHLGECADVLPAGPSSSRLRWRAPRVVPDARHDTPTRESRQTSVPRAHTRSCRAIFELLVHECFVDLPQHVHRLTYVHRDGSDRPSSHGRERGRSGPFPHTSPITTAQSPPVSNTS